MHFFFLTLSFLLTRYCKVFKQQCLSSDFSPSDFPPSDFSPIDSTLFPILLPFSLSHDLLLLVTDRPSSNIEEIPRACTHAYLPTGFLIFCCHKCHTKSIFTTIFHPFPSLFCLLIQVFPSFKIIPPNDILNNSSF